MKNSEFTSQLASEGLAGAVFRFLFASLKPVFRFFLPPCRQWHSDENPSQKRPDDGFASGAPTHRIHACRAQFSQHLRLTIPMFKIQNSAPTAPLDLRLP
jgi:hypothetical protein